MNNKFAAVTIFVGLVCLGYLIFQFFSGVEYPTPKNSIIVAFGDSLVEGVGATNGKNFVALLSQKINRPIINMGKSGDTTASGLARINEVIEKDPGTVLLLLGGNDFLRKVPQATTEQNLRSIISRLQENGTFVILLGVRGGVLKDDYAGMYEKLSEEYNLPYVSNVLAGLLTRREYMADAIHPNNMGYTIVAERVYQVVKDLKL